jgi:hypothetical protein
MARTTRVQMEPFNDYSYEIGTSGYILERSRTEIVDRHVNESQVVQGTVLWLPAKGAIEEGIFNHPVVVVSRPEDESHVIHFHLVSTSLLPTRRLG